MDQCKNEVISGPKTQISRASWFDKKGANDTSVALMNAPGLKPWGDWTVPMSMREVEPGVRLIWKIVHPKMIQTGHPNLQHRMWPRRVIDVRSFDSQSYNKTRIGEIRPSQLLWTFGPGALIDLPNMSL